MKTEIQIKDRLEKLVTQLEEFSKDIPEEWLDGNAPLEKQVEIAVLLSSLSTIAWTLDYEEQLKPLFTTLRMAHVLDKVKYV